MSWKLKTDCWNDVLPLYMLAYRSALQTSIRYSPAYLKLGHELPLPIELMTPPARLRWEILLCTPWFVKEDYSRPFVKNAIRAQTHQQGIYDQRNKGHGYNVRDQVLLNTPCSPQGSLYKFYKTSKGPYEVTFVRSRTICVIRQVSGRVGKLLTVHCNHLKPIYQPQNY